MKTDVDKMNHTPSAVTLNIDDLQSECTGIEINLEISRFVCQKLLEKKRIKEEEKRCIQEAVSTNLRLENLVDKAVIRMKERYAVQKILVSKIKGIKMCANKKLRYLVFDEDEIFKWRDECKKGMPIDYNFKFCKGTLSNFEGSKGILGELSSWDDSFDEPVEPRRYDVIRYKAEPIPTTWPADDDTNKVYMYAQLIELTDYKHYFLYRLTSVNLHLLDEMIDSEINYFKFQENECHYCRKTLTDLCQLHDNVSEIWEIAENRYNNESNQLQTISEYKEMVEELGYGHDFKILGDLWMLLGRPQKMMLLLGTINGYLNIYLSPVIIFDKLQTWLCYSFLEKIFHIVVPKISLETLRAFLIPFFNVTSFLFIYAAFSSLLQFLF